MASTVYYYTMDCRTEHQNKESKVARLCNLLKLCFRDCSYFCLVRCCRTGFQFASLL